MKRIVLLIFCSVFVLVMSSTTSAQALKSAKGFFCGMSEGDGGYPSIRVNGKERRFAIYGDELDVLFVGFKNDEQKGLWKLPVGTEMIVHYVFKKPNSGGSRTDYC